MLKKVLILGLCGALIGGSYFFWSRSKKEAKEEKRIVTSPKLFLSPTAVTKHVVESSAIFVPYWNIPFTDIYDTYQDLYYFGISANSTGVDKSDVGYLSLEKFTASAQNKNRYLTLRMLDADENSIILKDKSLQQTIIKETLETAQQYGFKGVILDLEQSVFPFNHVVEEINSFEADFYASAKQNKISFKETIYGDTFYLKRPFDVKVLAQNSDGVIIMAYDFSKANGDPGPNFPFTGKEKFGYDFQQMIMDFLAFVPANKITVVFGMYGYDWITDYKGSPLQTGKSVALENIQANYIQKCDWKNCVVNRDTLAAETEINYVDSSSSAQLIYHTIWFEDQRSVARKKEFLKEKGIGSTGYWAFGYF